MTKNYDIQAGDQLKKLFPSQFSNPDATFTFYRGWMPIVAGLCLDLDALLGDQRERFFWKQMKEKFGSARLYYQLDDESITMLDIHNPEDPQSVRIQPEEASDLFLRVDSLVEAAEKETSRSCMVCGAPAQTRNYAGYLMTLCGAHHPGVIGADAVQEMAKPRSSSFPGPTKPTDTP
jgi:hypothetical protein